MYSVIVRCVQALCNSLSTECRGPLGTSNCSTMPGPQRVCAVRVCAAMTSQPLSCVLLLCHHLAAKTEHPVQLNQESLPFNSPRTLSFIILSFSCFSTCKYLIKRNYQQNFSGTCRFLFHQQHETRTIYNNNSYHWCDGRATHLV